MSNPTRARKRAQEAQRELRDPTNTADIAREQRERFERRPLVAPGRMRADGLFSGRGRGMLVGPRDFAKWLAWHRSICPPPSGPVPQGKRTRRPTWGNPARKRA